MGCLGRGYIRHLFPTSHSGLVFCVLNHAGLLLDYTAEPGGSPPGGELLLACGFSCLTWPGRFLVCVPGAPSSCFKTAERHRHLLAFIFYLVKETLLLNIFESDC